MSSTLRSAWALAATRFIAMIAPTLTVVLPPAGVAEIATPAFRMRDSMRDRLSAMTSIPAPALTVAPAIRAIASAGTGDAKFVPTNASAELNRIFEGRNPIELNASVTPIAYPFASVVERFETTARESFAATTETLPSPPAVRLPSVTVDSASDSTALVTIIPLTASESPLPQALPPLDVTVLTFWASIPVRSSATTEIEPAAVAATFSNSAITRSRTSFLTTRPPNDAEFELLMLRLSPGIASVGLSEASGAQFDVFRKFSVAKFRCEGEPTNR